MFGHREGKQAKWGWNPREVGSPARQGTQHRFPNCETSYESPQGEPEVPLAGTPAWVSPHTLPGAWLGPAWGGGGDSDLRSYPWPGPEKTGGCLTKPLPYAGVGRAAGSAQPLRATWGKVGLTTVHLQASTRASPGQRDVNKEGDVGRAPQGSAEEGWVMIKNRSSLL